MDETADRPLDAPAMTYLGQVAVEGHELLHELRAAGFDHDDAVKIVALMVIDALDSRYDDDYAIVSIESEEDDEDYEDDPYDDGDRS